jgi:uncharacterized protein (TIGR03437 family)
MELPYVTLALKPSASQQADLDRLLAQQQDPSSPNYHRWLTPEQYADRFGLSQADIDKIVAWQGRYGLTVKSVARGRNAIAFGGPAGQIGRAFGVELHRYQVGGEEHFANAADPTIPVAFEGVVLAIRGLHDFRWKPKLRHSLQPRDNFNGAHQLGPADIAAIYDMNPLYNAGYTGTGQKLAIAGQTDIQLSDIEQFRTYFNLPANDPTVILVPGSPDPGIQSQSGDLSEADLDLELSGAVAPNATILYVNADPSFGAGGAVESLHYAIDQNLAPVISVSYGDCELDEGSLGATMLSSWAMQANTQGQTIFAASGDNGAADCFGDGDGPAIDDALSVDMPGSLPQVTGVGGTEFNEGSGSYWNSTNGRGQVSARSYIPETAWNDSARDGSPSASGGGASTFYTKPSWQTGTGVPSDGARDVPDVSISASADHDGYMIYTGGAFQIMGGTSAGGPQFAGIAVLLSQYLVANGYQPRPELGNINSGLYALASVTGVFHDITAGNNMVVPCAQQRGCTLPAVGYDSGVGYDRVTGLGTPDVYNLVTAWHTRSVGKPAASITLSFSEATFSTFTGSTTLTATVTASGPTPTGDVTLTVGTYSLATAALSAASNGKAVATLPFSLILLASGANTITAQYGGDTDYSGATASATVTIALPAPGQPALNSGGLLNGASFTQALAPGGVLSIYGSNLASASGSAPFAPLPVMMAGTAVTINGIPAPLYYVSPAQLNVQVPYQIPAGSTATVMVKNNGESASATFDVSAKAPAIFTFGSDAPVPYATAARGQEIETFITGAGAVSPAVATGATPAAGTALAGLPAPTGTVGVTVGGVNAVIDFAGIPTWSVGVVQINYTVPPNAPVGLQPVLVSVGGVQSVSAELTVQ